MSGARRARIIGLGLIGGSIGIALRRSGWHVTFADPAVSLADARNAGAADEEDAGDVAADVTIVATPVDAALETVAKCSGLTTSVCSVMAPLREKARGANFVAGHPLAGAATSGLASASGDLFRGKRWFVDADDPVVDSIIRDCGAIRERVDAATHDAAVAVTSHLPQILSTALAAHLGRSGSDLRFAGSGLQTLLRLAQSDASVWTPVIAANRAAIAANLDEVVRIAGAILSGDGEAFHDAQQFVRRLSET